jgi:AcrR family transcriptional regulator
VLFEGLVSVVTDTSSSSKGSETRQRIVDHAFMRASAVGLEGLSIGRLATDLGLSKSGLFAHFQSKEKLQLEVLARAAENFKEAVFLPALRQPRGLKRIRAMFEAWLEWVHDDKLPGGCVFLGGATEWDDREGPVRDELVLWFAALRKGLERAVSLAVETGEFREDLDVGLFCYEMHGLVIKYHVEARLSRNRSSQVMARRAFERLVDDAQTSARKKSVHGRSTRRRK